jgi:aspartate 1-decarboxylase
MLKSKIHRARVTDGNIAYEGSVTIDKTLMEAADILPYEQVHILNINNGARFHTYAIEGKENGGDICLNGAAARMVAKGDIVIILTYHELEEAQCRDYHPRLVYVDEKNRITHTKGVMDEALDILRENTGVNSK